MVQHLLQGFVHDPWLRGLNFSTLQPVPTNLITAALGERHMDTAWKLSPREGMDVYVLIEFQSTPVPHMALRTCTYSTLLYEAMLEQKVTSNKDPHWPPILCVVIYNGKRRWRGALGLQQRIWKPPVGSLKRYQLQHRFKLVDINKEVLENKTDEIGRAHV